MKSSLIFLFPQKTPLSKNTSYGFNLILFSLKIYLHWICFTERHLYQKFSILRWSFIFISSTSTSIFSLQNSFNLQSFFHITNFNLPFLTKISSFFFISLFCVYSLTTSPLYHQHELISSPSHIFNNNGPLTCWDVLFGPLFYYWSQSGLLKRALGTWL